MAIRTVREEGDDLLRKISKPVKKMNNRLATLIEDMFETMYEMDGVGLAAPQVGVLKRLFVIDPTGEDPQVFINPEILETEGEQVGPEGCLSVPGKSGTVKRAEKVKVRALDENMEEFIYEAEGLAARAVLHENDHLDGILYVDKVIGDLREALTLPAPEDIKVIFMGTPDFASAILSRMIEEGYDIPLVVTQPDRPKGRSKELIPSPVKVVAGEHGIEVFQPESMKDEAAIQKIEEVGADLIVVAAFGQILPERVIEAAAHDSINVHASLLPKYRGAAPIQRAILDGEKETGVTIMKIVKALDAGDILTQRVIEIADDETGGSLFDKMTQEGADLLVETIPMYVAGAIEPKPQVEEESTYAAMLKKEEGRVDWSRETAVIERMVRGLYPWPGAYTFVGDRRMKLIRALAGDIPETVTKELSEREPGSVAVEAQRMFVKTGDGVLELTQIQPEGKRSMSAAEYLRGANAPDVLES